MSNLKVQRDTPPMEYGDKMDLDRLVLATSTRTDTYRRPISEAERASYAQEVTDLSIEIEDKEAEKKETMKMYSDGIKDAKERRRTAITTLKSGVVEVADTIYTHIDAETMRVHEYNSAGERILTRRMKPSETQTTIPTHE